MGIYEDQWAVHEKNMNDNDAGPGGMTAAFLAGAATYGVRQAQRNGTSPAQGAADAIAVAVADTVEGTWDLMAALTIFITVGSALMGVGVGGVLLFAAALPVYWAFKAGQQYLVGTVCAALFVIVVLAGGS